MASETYLQLPTPFSTYNCSQFYGGHRETTHQIINAEKNEVLTTRKKQHLGHWGIFYSFFLIFNTFKKAAPPPGWILVIQQLVTFLGLV